MGSRTGITGVNVVGRVSGAFGMAVAARATIGVLLAGGVDVAIADIASDPRGRALDQTYLHLNVADTRDLPHEVTLFLDSPWTVGELLTGRPETLTGRYNALVPFWELTRVPRSWFPVLQQMDSVLAPTRFIANAIQSSVGVPVRDIPVTPLIPPGAARRPSVLRGEKAFTFFTGFDVLSSIERKNPNGTLAAFLGAFAGRADVALVAKVWGVPEGRPSGLDELAARHANLRFVHDDLGYDDVLALMRDCDAYVSLHRAEGLGLGMLEAMQFGRPAVATDYSGNTDFLDDTNGIPVPFALVPVNAPEPVFSLEQIGAQTYWADPDLAAAQAGMKRLVDDRATYERLSARARETVTERRARFASLRWLDHIDERLRARKLTARGPLTVPGVTSTNGAAAGHAAAGAAPQAPYARLDDEPGLLLEGEYHTPHSMAHINRELGARLIGDPSLRFAGSSVGPRYDGILLPAQLEERLLDPGAATRANPALRVWHLWPPHWERRRAERYVVCQPWEYGEIPRDWANAIGRDVDGVWAHTTYVRDMYLRAGVAEDRVALIPLGVDTEILRPDGPRAQLKTGRSFNFLFVGGSIARKGIDVLVNTYLKTFGPGDDVALVIKDGATGTFYRGQNLKHELEPLAKRTDIPKIVYIDEQTDDAGVAALYRSCQAFVLPFRGEGFGMPILEAMACGLPVIVSRGGAADDFADDTVGITIPAARTSLGDDLNGTKLVRPGWWLEPDSDALAAAMRALYRDPGLARKLGAAGAQRAHAGWTWEHSAAAARAAIAPWVGAAQAVRA